MATKEGAGNGGNSTVEVTVHYQEQSKTKAFGRGDKIADVLAWTIQIFGIDGTVATEVELALAGTTEELAGSKPLASLVHGAGTVVFDLIRGDIANGAV